jgi:hypothetical protein
MSVPGLRAFQRAYPCAQTRGVEKRLISGPIGEMLQILVDPYLTSSWRKDWFKVCLNACCGQGIAAGTLIRPQSCRSLQILRDG